MFCSFVDVRPCVCVCLCAVLFFHLMRTRGDSCIRMLCALINRPYRNLYNYRLLDECVGCRFLIRETKNAKRLIVQAGGDGDDEDVDDDGDDDDENAFARTVIFMERVLPTHAHNHNAHTNDWRRLQIRMNVCYACRLEPLCARIIGRLMRNDAPLHIHRADFMDDALIRRHLHVARSASTLFTSSAGGQIAMALLLAMAIHSIEPHCVAPFGGSVVAKELTVAVVRTGGQMGGTHSSRFLFHSHVCVHNYPMCVGCYTEIYRLSRSERRRGQ